MKNVVVGSLALVAVVSLTGNVLLYKRYSTSRPLVRVGSEVIRVKDYRDTLDHDTQGSVLRKMVFTKLVRQAAAKAGLMPSSQDVDARIATLQRRNPQALGDALQNPAKMAELRDGLTTDLALENLRLQGVTVGDSEIAAYYAAHKPEFALPTQVQTTLVVAENPVDASTAAALLQQNTPLDVIARQPRLHVAGMNGFHPTLTGMPPAVNRTVYLMKPGEVKSVPFGSHILVFRANKTLAAVTPPLNQVKPAVTRAAKLAKAPDEAHEIAKIYHSTPVTFEVDQYAAYFADVQNAPGAASVGSEKTASAR